MTDHKTTTAEEMYLIAIFALRSENPQVPVPISTLAEKQNVQPVSVNQMVRKMAEEGWVEYLPYKGVLLTAPGAEHALRVLRVRRLWEVFLVRELGIPLDEAETLACDLEHHISEKVAERLDDFLNHPNLCYHGKSIPRKMKEGDVSLESIPLTDIPIGATGTVVQILADENTQRFLMDEEIRPGVKINIAAIGSRGDTLIDLGGGRICLSQEIASAVMLRKDNTI